MRPQTEVRYMYTTGYLFLVSPSVKILDRAFDSFLFFFFSSHTEKGKVGRKTPPDNSRRLRPRIDDEDHPNSTPVTMELIFHSHDNGINLPRHARQAAFEKELFLRQSTSRYLSYESTLEGWFLNSWMIFEFLNLQYILLFMWDKYNMWYDIAY